MTIIGNIVIKDEILKQNPAKIANNKCPADKLAARRTPKDTTLDM